MLWARFLAKINSKDPIAKIQKYYITGLLPLRLGDIDRESKHYE